MSLGLMLDPAGWEKYWEIPFAHGLIEPL